MQAHPRVQNALMAKAHATAKAVVVADAADGAGVAEAASVMAKAKTPQPKAQMPGMAPPPKLLPRQWWKQCRRTQFLRLPLWRLSQRPNRSRPRSPQPWLTIRHQRRSRSSLWQQRKRQYRQLSHLRRRLPHQCHQSQPSPSASGDRLLKSRPSAWRC